MKLQTRTHRVIAGTAIAGMIAAGCVAMMPSGSAGIVAKSTSASCKESMEMWLYRSEGAQSNNMRLKLRQVAKDCATSERVYMAGSGIAGSSGVMRAANDCEPNYQLPAGDWMIKAYNPGSTRGFFQSGVRALAGRSAFEMLPVGAPKCPNRSGFAIHSDIGVRVPSSSTSSARTSNGCIKLTGTDLTDLHRRWAALSTIAEGSIRIHVVTVLVSALPAPGGGSVAPTPTRSRQDTRPDFNGDGRTDIIGRSGIDVQVALSNGGGFNGSTRWTTWKTAYTLSTGDFNGDGRTDIIGRNGNDVQVALSNGGGFNGSTRWTTWQSAYTLEPGDYNGDGRTDIFGRNPSTGDIQVALSNGAGFNGSTRWGFWSSNYTLGRADVNGDGRLDLVGRNVSTGDVQVSMSSGAGFNGSTRWGFWSSKYTLGTGDYNGDGRADLIGRAGTDVQVSLSNGGSFNGSTRWTTWKTAYTMGVGDYNGDGRADLIGRAGTDIQVALSNGGSLNGSTRWTPWNTAYSLGTGNQFAL